MHYRPTPFVWQGVTITDPTLDPTGRFEVPPDYYYRDEDDGRDEETKEPENRSVEAEVARAMSRQFFAKYAPSYGKQKGSKQ